MALIVWQKSPLNKQDPKYLSMYWQILVHVTIVFQMFESLQGEIIFKALSTKHSTYAYRHLLQSQLFSAENLLISFLIVVSHFFALSKKPILNKLVPGSSST